ncbi:MAG: alpha/beta fold hydrolase [Bacteroidia bacterium]
MNDSVAEYLISGVYTNKSNWTDNHNFKMTEIQKYLISNDGTKIGYRQIGNGDGLIIVHGTGRISQSYQRLALALADNFTVYTYDRRGRGLSGPLTTDHSITKEVEDLVALSLEAKAKYIFGHSFGGVISLQASTLCEIKKLAVYEPPISIDNSIPDNWLSEFEDAISRNKKVKAMTIFLKALPPPDISSFPKWTLTLLVYAVKFMERNKNEESKMLNLLYTIPPDMRIVKQLEPIVEKYKDVTTPTLLMSGTKSQEFFQQSVKFLGQILPTAQTEIFEGFDHYSPEEKVQEISKKLKQFYNDY